MINVRMLAIAIGVLAATAYASDEDRKATQDAAAPAGVSAHEAVRQGNERLGAGQPDQALESYLRAEELEPEAREIGFVEGLAHFDLREYEQAREAFRRAAGVEYDDLSADAFYSLAATDHAEALASMESAPQEALSQLESAMRRYHEVLSQRPDHRAARDANRRAASMWRKLKQQLQEQQQQNQDQDKKNEDQEEQDQQQNQEGDPKDQEQSDQQEQQSSESDDQSEDQQQQPAQADKQEEVSREQAERKLREMMQAVRDRKKERREQTRKVRLAPVEKDW